MNSPSKTHPESNRIKDLEERARQIVSEMTLHQKVSQMLHESPEIPELDIPQYNWWNECLHGVARAGRATIFPQAIGLAATFDPDFVLQVAQVISDEGRAKFHAARAAGNRVQYRGLTFWTPNVNIFRDPRWGRGQETYGEDPWLTTQMGLAFVKGLQEEKDGVMKAAACAKHYAVHSGPEGERHTFDAVVSSHDLWDTYLPAFQALVTQGQVEAVMGAYNRVNGEAACGSKTLLVDILRNQWGFKGHVVSDCWAIRDFHEHHKITKTPEESAALAISMGCDLNCGCTFESAAQAVEQGLVEEKCIDESVVRLLTTRMKLGILDDDQPNPWEYLSLEIVNSPAHRELARDAAVKSLVLLKNNGVLPLNNSKIKKIYVTGPNAFNPEALVGNYYGVTSRVVTALEGISARIPEGITIDYRRGALLDREKENPVDWAIFEAASVDVTLAFMGLDSSLEGEEGDAIASVHKGDRPTLGLPAGQLDFLQRIKQAGSTLVVVLFGGSALAVSQIHQIADAVIMAWYPGEEGGTALAQVLFGDVSPSGALPVTWYKDEKDLPAFDDYTMEGRTYRYFRGTPLYPFGFGLTYTSWEFAKGSVEQTSNGWRISAKVTNTGSYQASLPVQLYATAPNDSTTKLTVSIPESSLRGLSRVALKPGESRIVSFDITVDDLSLVNEQGHRVPMAGDWTLVIGACSPGSRGVELGAPKPVSCVVNQRL